MPELGAVTRALLAIARDTRDDRALAGEICRACVEGLDIDGAAISLLTADPLRETVFASDATADLLEDLQFSLGEGACIDAALTRRPCAGGGYERSSADGPAAEPGGRSTPLRWCSRPVSGRSSRCRCSGAPSMWVFWIFTVVPPVR